MDNAETTWGHRNDNSADRIIAREDIADSEEIDSSKSTVSGKDTRLSQRQDDSRQHRT